MKRKMDMAIKKKNKKKREILWCHEGRRNGGGGGGWGRRIEGEDKEGKKMKRKGYIKSESNGINPSV
jgi:hypothetical protein